MTSTLRDEEHKSDCCGAPVKVVGDSFGEGTNHWECEKCGESCNDTFYVGHSKRECTCASFFTVRGVHKKDCPCHVTPSPEEGWKKRFLRELGDVAVENNVWWVDEGEKWNIGNNMDFESAVVSLVSRLISQEREKMEAGLEDSAWAKAYKEMAIDEERARVIEIAEGMKRVLNPNKEIPPEVVKTTTFWNAALSDLIKRIIEK